MIKRRFYRLEHGDRDAPSESSSSDSEVEAEATDGTEDEEEVEEDDEVGEGGEKENVSSSSGYESEDSSVNKVNLDSSGPKEMETPFTRQAKGKAISTNRALGTGSSRVIVASTPAPPPPPPHHEDPGSSAPTPPDPLALKRKRKTANTGPSFVDVSTDDSGEPSQTSVRRVTPPPHSYSPQFPPEYHAQANLFEAHQTDLGLRIVAALGTETEMTFMASKDLMPSIHEGYNRTISGLMQIHNGMVRMMQRYHTSERLVGRAEGDVLNFEKLEAELKEVKFLYQQAGDSFQQRMQAVGAELKQTHLQLEASKREIQLVTNEFEAHKSEVEAMKETVAAARTEAEEARSEADIARAEAAKAKADLEAYIAKEEDRKAAFLHSPEFINMVGPRAFKYLTVGFEGCRDIFKAHSLIPEDKGPDFPDLTEFILSLPDDI